ncbi:MAG TPA: UDP-N-acetylglucosamine 2-epimerase (non-hydrolyzing) [Anaerolineales bacterium]|nr:UDP-N-acetylglucosamine 2-epimerase (non-hydrolyzing) [Anaerolineales bacterium]
MPDRPLKVLSVFGTRPEAVKMAPVVERLQWTPGVTSRVCVTAQHREMLDQVLSLFGISPDIDLDLMQSDQSLGDLTASLFRALDGVLRDERPDWVLVQGDTTTVMAASLSAYYHRCKVAHVEAGLRTGDKWQPFPEEINRRIAGVVADLHFAPTNWARDNLLREGTPPDRVVVTGNPVIDALQGIARRPYDWSSGPLADVPRDRRLILVTAHRRENFGKPLEDIFAALGELASIYAGDVHLVYPVHLNPNVREPARARLGRTSNISLTAPLDYLPMVHLLQASTLVLTDSGGLQEEAPALGKPVLVMRRVTERPEAVEAGTAKLVGTDPEAIVRETRRLLDDSEAYAAMARAVNPFGDGHAAERIIEALLAAA